jgi:predicted ATPase/DNA-binding SARP family transcriptional activator
MIPLSDAALEAARREAERHGMSVAEVVAEAVGYAAGTVCPPSRLAATGVAMDFRILGSFEVVGEAGSITLCGPERRGLLAWLATHAGQPVDTDRLIEELWGGGGSDSAAATVQAHVSKIRTLLGPDGAALQTCPGGYLLAVDPGDVDALRFERDVAAAGAEPDVARRLALLDEALALWRGPPLEEFAGARWADQAIRRLEAVHLHALQRRGDALLALDRAEDAAELEPVARAHPLDERLWAQLMLSLYRTGRQADALDAYEQVRRHLVDELGIEPGPELATLERRIRDRDPGLASARNLGTADHATETPMPSGLVTFVITDIEGSTRLLRRLEERYDAVLARHDALLSSSWKDNGGAHVSARGDSHLAAFGDAASALHACADAQRQLAAELWPSEGGPRVRMGVHTGLASPRDGDYVALAVHQAARVMAAAHGGQILASDVAATEAGSLGDLELRFVGRYRLRDFDGPVALSCLSGPGLDTDFPAVRAMPVDGHNLAPPHTSLVGREADLADLLTRLSAGRLLTLTGPGGVGKSRLALAAGLATAPHWGDGVWLVDASSMQDARLVGAAVADVVGVAVGTGVDAWQAALDHMSGRPTLLLLDNCEHLAPGLAPLITELLRRCPEVGVLATSRQPLGIARESVVRVEPLGLPTLGASVDEALAAPSVRLFVERARAARSAFAVDDHNLQAVVQLCRRLDGLPLALELAAAHTSVLSVADLLRGLDDRFRVLSSRQRGVPDRQRTMDEVMGWSYRLLAADEQAMLRRLGVFRSGFSLEAAVVAGGDLRESDVPGLLWALVDKSLVAVDPTANETRYRLLETMTAYARQLAGARGEQAGTARRLATWWLERVGPWHRVDRERAGEIQVELDNLRALVELVAEEQAQQLACSIGHYYYAVQAPRDAVGELSRYAAGLPSPSPARVSLLATLALLQVQHGDTNAARGTLVDAEHLQRTVGGAPEWDQVAVERAAGEVAIRSGDHTAAVELAQQALDRDLNAPARARMLNLLAIASYFLGDVTRAQAAFSDELDVARELGDEHLIVLAEGNVAELAMRRGDTAAAASHQAACLHLGLALGRPVAVAYSLIVAARLTAGTDPGRAARLHAKAELVLADSGHKMYDDDLRASEEMLERVRRDIGEVEYRQACDSGRSLTLLNAAALAQDALTFGKW